MNKIDPGLGINRRYLHDEVADRMRELIQSGEMEPRSRINEGELTERFGISRTPLREAIKILATEGLLELLPNRGARVASISRAELEEMIEVIAGLEATACDLACRAATEAEIDAIQADHDAIMAAARNTTLAGLYQSLSGRIQHSRYTAHQSAAQWAQSVSEHERMMVLLRARDGVTLATLMREHIRGKRLAIAANYGDADAD